MSGQAPDSIDRPELTALERALSGLTPVPAALDRDDLLFRAGQAAAPRHWFWPAAAAVSTATAVVLAVVLVSRPAPSVVEHVVYIRVERPPTEQPPASQEPEPEVEVASVPPQARTPAAQSQRRRLEKHLYRWGFDGMGQPPAPPPANPFIPPLYLPTAEVTP